MWRLLTVIAFLAAGIGSAMAQNVISTPPQVGGFGTLAVTNASALVSTLTLGPNSAPWPSAPGMVYVTNRATSAGNVYVCPLGGTCTTAGSQLTQARPVGYFKPSTALTVIADSTATIEVQW